MNDICFKLNNKCLYTDEELVNFNIPIFFVCRDDENNKYAVLCIDSEQLVYIVAQCSIESILAMLNSQITLRDFFLHTGSKWKVYAGEDYLSDEVEEITKMQEDELPANQYFELANAKIADYIKRLTEESPIVHYSRSYQQNLVLFNLPVVYQKINIVNNLIDDFSYLSENSGACYTACHYQQDKQVNIFNTEQYGLPLDDQHCFTISRGGLCYV